MAADLVKKRSGFGGLIDRATALWKKLAARKGIAHLLRAAKRFVARLGTQFAGAITYFSFLSLVPLLMLSFSVAGFVLAAKPSLIDDLKGELQAYITDPSLMERINELIDESVNARFGVAIVGLVVALYSGIGWMGNLKEAIGAQWRPRFEVNEKESENFVLGLAKNLLALVGLGLGIVVSIALTSVASAANGWVKELLGVENVGWIDPLLAIGPVAVAVIADTLIFFWIYTILPRPKDFVPRKYVIRGAVLAAVGFEVLKFAITIIIPMTSGSPATAVFGPIIGLLLFINLVSQLILFVAAWISTANPEVEPNPAPVVEQPAPVIIRPHVTEPPTLPASVPAYGLVAAAGYLLGRRRRR